MGLYLITKCIAKKLYFFDFDIRISDLSMLVKSVFYLLDPLRV